MRPLHLCSIALWLCAAPLAQGQEIPVGGALHGVEGLRLITGVGIQAKLDQTKLGDNAAAARVQFEKKGEERRLLALEAPIRQSPQGARAVVLTCQLQLTEGEAPRPAFIAYENDGGAWFTLGSRPTATGEAGETRLSLSSLKKAAFGQDADTEVQWDQVERVWIGLALDGPAKGTWEIGRAFFTSQPYRPSQPLRLTGAGPGNWTVGKDPDAKGEVSTPNEGPEGQACMRFDLTFPAARHMYALPSTPVPDAELEGYRVLRFRYKATLPEGLKGLLVTLRERSGGQYYLEPPASPEWTVLEAPFEDFQAASWGKDENQRLDVDQLDAVIIGTHGSATKGGSGTIWVADLEFAP